MDRGRMLADASHVLVQVAGGPAMTLSEVEILMQELGRHINDRTQILFGTSVDGRMGNRLSVTLISSLSTEEEVAPAIKKSASRAKPEPVVAPEPEPVAPPVPPIWEQREDAAAATPEQIPAPIFSSELIQMEEPPEIVPDAEPITTAYLPAEPAIEEAPPQPRVILPKKKPAPIKEPRPFEEKKLHAKQEVLQFEPVTRGRFEKSEPTIVEGQDLDIPTFLRKNVRVK
jgi:cell division protein FtsZ